MPLDPARRSSRSRPDRRRARGGAPGSPVRGVPRPRARPRARTLVRRQGPESAPPRPLPPEGARRHGAHGRGAPLGRVRGRRGRLGLLRHGRFVRLRARALRHLGRARQSPAGARGQGRGCRHRDRRARRLLPPADPAPGRPPRQASGRSPARVSLALALAALVAVLLAAFVKGAIGFGFPTLGTPLLALAVDVKSAVALLVIPNLMMDSLQLRRSGPLGDAPRRLAPLLLFTIIGTVIGTRLLVALSARAVTLLLGAFVLSYVLLDLARFSPRVPAGWERRLAVPVGLAAGIMGGITNAPGTAIALYFVAMGMDKQEFVRSIAFTFLVVKTVQLATLVWYGLLGWTLVLGSLGLAAAGLAGFGLGLRLQDRLDQRSFNRAVLVFMAVLGVWLVARAL
ncbi:MAG: hypothetical protein DMD87_15570 [Candidatus Rokuibacteriota bacterium]|nr:MAG: hypothetical protein DMD87_15570 [Candidatus Rokubacteria bacterium]